LPSVFNTYRGVFVGSVLKYFISSYSWLVGWFMVFDATFNHRPAASQTNFIT